MERNILWSPWNEPGLEHLHLSEQRDEIVADGVIIALMEQLPFRVRYTIHCDTLWRVRELHIERLDGSGEDLGLKSNGEGHWITTSGTPMPLLDGCLDVDISATPFTNTLPIRRLNLTTGAAAEIAVAYIKVPELQLQRLDQRYTCLENNAAGGKYRYESLWTHFTADLIVDTDGLVINYPELFRRI